MQAKREQTHKTARAYLPTSLFILIDIFKAVLQRALGTLHAFVAKSPTDCVMQKKENSLSNNTLYMYGIPSCYVYFLV